MKRCQCVLVADEGRARVFTVGEERGPERRPVPVLIERESVVDPAARLPGRELVSEAMTGRGKGGPADNQQVLDDRREPRSKEVRRRHARVVAETLRRVIEREPSGGLVVVAAPPKMLGALREALSAAQLGAGDLVEIGEDLTRLDAHQLHAHLAERELLPPRPVLHPRRG